MNRYDIIQNRWEPMKEMPISLNRAGAVSCNGLIYIFGGNNSLVYTPSENKWKKITSMIHPRSGFTIVNVKDREEYSNYIYIIGGFTGLGPSSHVRRYYIIISYQFIRVMTN